MHLLLSLSLSIYIYLSINQTHIKQTIAINYDVVSSIVNHGVTDCMQLEAQNFPLMMVENMFTSNEDKYKVRIGRHITC
jgi:hypothetical protein